MIATIVCDSLNFTQDVLSGLNVREFNYLIPEDMVDCCRLRQQQDHDMESVHVPFAVYIWIDDDSFGDCSFHSAHNTRADAEKEVAWLNHDYTTRCMIEEDATMYRYQIEDRSNYRYHSINC